MFVRPGTSVGPRRSPEISHPYSTWVKIMSKTSWIRGLVLAAVFAWMGTAAKDAQATPVKVQFSMTISESPFSEGSLTVGGTITGEYTYDLSATPFNSGLNFADYLLLSGSLSAGLDTWKTSVVQLKLAHGIGTEIFDGSVYQPSDVYEVFFFSPIVGPFIGEWRPSYWALVMVDTDASVYADLSFPLAFPDPDLFEVKQRDFRRMSSLILIPSLWFLAFQPRVIDHWCPRPCGAVPPGGEMDGPPRSLERGSKRTA